MSSLLLTPGKELCGMVEDEMNLVNVPDTISQERDIDITNFVRRSARNPEVTHVTRPDVWKLRQKLKGWVKEWLMSSLFFVVYYRFVLISQK